MTFQKDVLVDTILRLDTIIAQVKRRGGIYILSRAERARPPYYTTS
jgi:hypothetical protein